MQVACSEVALICVCEFDRKKRNREFKSVEVILKCVVGMNVGRSIVAEVSGEPE